MGRPQLCSPTWVKGLRQNLRQIFQGRLSLSSCSCSGLKLRSGQEGLNKRIELEEHEPHLVHRMLQHLYKLDYFAGKIELDGKKENSFVSELHTHVMMYAMGDEYDVMDLKKKSLRKFTEAVKAKKGRKDELASVLKVVPAIYTTTPDSDRGLREFVVGLGAEHLERMKDLPELKDAVTQAPNYMIEILPKYFRRVQDEKDKEKNWCECDKCSNLDLKFDRVLCRECGHQQNLSVVDMVDVP